MSKPVNFKNGVASFGITQIGSDDSIPTTTGIYFFVDSVTGNDGNDGKSKEKALATIDAAINKCTANKGDVIIVMPNHAETISDATSLVPDVAGISIVGLGNGSNQPEITFDDTSSQIIVTGANSLFRNLRFVAGVSAIIEGVAVDASNVTFEGCKWTWSTTSYDFLIMARIDAQDYVTFDGCEFEAEPATAGAADAISLDDAEHITIRNCYFHGDFSAACIYNASADAAGKHLVIANNLFYNDDTGAASNGIDLDNAYTGIIVGNMIGSLYDTAIDAVIDPGSCLNIENYCCNSIDEYGAILPGATPSN